MNDDFIEVNPARMSGVPCFKGTRVPVTHLFDYLEAAHLWVYGDVVCVDLLLRA